MKTVKQKLEELLGLKLDKWNATRLKISYSVRTAKQFDKKKGVYKTERKMDKRYETHYLL